MDADFEPRRAADGSIDYGHYRRRAAVLRAAARRQVILSACRWGSQAVVRLTGRLVAAFRVHRDRPHQIRLPGGRRAHGA